MSRPGDPGRRQLVLSGTPADLMADLVVLVGKLDGARTWETRYDAADRKLGPDEEPRPDEATDWTVSVVLRRRWPGTRRPTDRTFSSTRRCEPGGDNARAAVEAMADVLEQLGANVVLV